MLSYLHLVALNTTRSLIRGVRDRGLAWLAVGASVAFLAQWYVLSSIDQAGALQTGANFVLGWAVLALLAISTVTGPYSSRFPHRLADIAWLYTAPISLARIALAIAIWQGLLRTGVWVLAGVALDLANVFAHGTVAGATLRALCAAPLIFALTAWSMGTGSVRGSLVLTGVVLGIGWGAIAGMAGAIYIEAARQGGLAAGFATSLPSSFADALGAAMLGRPNLAGGLGICIIAVLGLLLMFAGTGPALRERISLDASFWADFSIGSSAAAASGSSGNKETWRGGTRLTGPAALTWFEIATLRRANFHVTGYSLLLVSAWLVGSYEPAFIILFILGTAGSVLTRAYLSGAILHLRLGNFALYPGGLLAKVCAAELPHAAASTLALALSLTLAGLAARFNWTLIADLVTLGISTVVLAFGIRILCGALAFLSSTNVPPSLFFLNVFATSAVLAAAIFSIFEVQRKLELPFNPELLPVAVAGIGVVSFAAGIRLLRKQLFHRRANKTSNTDRKRTGNCARNSSGHC